MLKIKEIAINKLKVMSEDVIIIVFPKRLTDKSIIKIKQDMKRIFTKNKILIFDEDIKINVLKEVKKNETKNCMVLF